MKTLRAHKFIAVCIVLAILIAGLVLSTVLTADDSQISAREDAVRETVRERALQCYVIENAYPESLDYLKENYGLTVNEEDYLIVYDLYAENQPPQIKVIYRGDSK
jgi:hypothetical protein